MRRNNPVSKYSAKSVPKQNQRLSLSPTPRNDGVIRRAADFKLISAPYAPATSSVFWELLERDLLPRRS
jgi:hypothetical protein